MGQLLTQPVCQTCSACSRVWHMTTKSSAYRTIADDLRPMRVATHIAHSSGLLHPVPRDVEQHRADHPALWSSLHDRGEPALLDHTGRQPPGNHCPGGERAEVGKQPLMVDAVERR